jgi:GSH-dependent disulfide-bond oxidoreductase
LITFYYNLSPNPTKVALFLEESGLPYELVPVDVSKGDQFEPEYLAVNPNGKVPAIRDGDIAVFDSNAILLYLAEKTGQFLPPPGAAGRAQLLSWLMFVASGVGPFSGQAVHFTKFAPEPVPYASKRYLFEADRHYRILDARLQNNHYMLGDTYTIADMAMWGWARAGVGFLFGEEAWKNYPNLRRLTEEISARPAAQRAVSLKDRHTFKANFDDAARKLLFRHQMT